jgi:short-subunit dehydrogenase
MTIIIIGIGNIGFEITKLLANNNSILLIARNLPEHVKDYITDYDSIFFAKGDATSVLDMERIKDSEVVEEFGTIDLIICTPGMASDSTLINDFEGFKHCFNLNYFAVLTPLKVFLNKMSADKGGKLILLSASSGHHADKRLSGYPASKWALENTYSSLREELRPLNISVDVIAVRTIKNKYSKVWTQNYGEDPENIAKYIFKLIQKPQNKRHFIPSRFSIIRIIERLFPRVLDYKHGLRNKRARKKLFQQSQSDIVLITGAASGLGKAFAYTYSKTAKVLYLCDIDMDGLVSLKDELITKNECIIHIAKVNILNEQDINNYTNSIDYVDLLINNAGVRYWGAIENTTLETFKQGLDINFFGPLLFIANFYNKKKQPKKIINILSTSAIRGRKMMSLYSSSKAALWNCTRSLRRVYGNKIQIIEVIPSFMSGTKLLENSKNNDEKNQTQPIAKNQKPNLQSKVKFLSVANWSTFDAAEKIHQEELRGEEIIFIPPIRAKLFLILETASNCLFSRLFKN